MDAKEFIEELRNNAADRSGWVTGTPKLKRGRKRLSRAKLKALRVLFDSNFKIAEIANVMNVSKTTIYTYKRELGINVA